MTKTKPTFLIGFLSLLTLNFLLLTPTAFAVGLQIKPSEIKIKAPAGEKITTRIQVFNPSPEVSVFDVYPDSFESQIKTSPTSFILESGQTREVFVSFEFSEIGQFTTNLSVIARPLSKNSFNAGGGLKIPVSVSISQNKNNLFANIFTFFGANQNSLVGLLAFVTILTFLILGVKLFLKKRTT